MKMGIKIVGLVVFALVLSACGSDGNQDGNIWESLGKTGNPVLSEEATNSSEEDERETGDLDAFHEDIYTLDAMCSAMTTSVVTVNAEGFGRWKYGQPDNDEEEKIEAQMRMVLGDGIRTLKTKDDDGKTPEIWLLYDDSKNEITVFGSSDGGQSSAKHGNNKYEVTNIMRQTWSN